ncbi:HesA/MoeB/ThiF family protein [Alkalihalobacillus sp. R86527]|uniref:HesA/MoeB/ThiF family protein n=1 Tax=Alkalihalobacillus sp. R86527 TaxID=3093863 RepID=UPI00366F3623
MKIIEFRPYIKVYMNTKENEVFLSRPLTDGDKGDTYELEEHISLLFKLIRDAKYTEEIIINKVTSQFPGTAQEVKNTLSFLLENNYINVTDKEIERSMMKELENYQRIIPLWSEFETPSLTRYEIQKNLMNKKIGVIGCGTIGTGVVSQLVSYGISDFVLMDSDTVDRTNLTRQTLFSLDDIGKPKVNVLKKFIESRIENSTINAVRQTFGTDEELSVFEHVDIVIFAADSSNLQRVKSDEIRALENMLEDFSKTHNIPIAFTGGYKGHTGRILPIVLPQKTHSLTCLIKNLTSNSNHLNYDYAIDLNNNSSISLSSTSEMSSIVSSIVSFEIIKFLSGVIPVTLMNKVLYVEFQKYTVDHIVFPEENYNCFCTTKKLDETVI